MESGQAIVGDYYYMNPTEYSTYTILKNVKKGTWKVAKYEYPKFQFDDGSVGRIVLVLYHHKDTKPSNLLWLLGKKFGTPGADGGVYDKKYIKEVEEVSWSDFSDKANVLKHGFYGSMGVANYTHDVYVGMNKKQVEAIALFSS